MIQLENARNLPVGRHKRKLTIKAVKARPGTMAADSPMAPTVGSDVYDIRYNEQ